MKSQNDILPCPFCGFHLIANDNPLDLYVRRYGTHYRHPSVPCYMADHEVTPAEVEAWSRRTRKH